MARQLRPTTTSRATPPISNSAAIGGWACPRSGPTRARAVAAEGRERPPCGACLARTAAQTAVPGAVYCGDQPLGGRGDGAKRLNLEMEVGGGPAVERTDRKGERTPAGAKAQRP